MTITQSGSPHSIAGRKQTSRPLEGGATFTLKHRLQRLLWQAAWLVPLQRGPLHACGDGTAWC
ncbi:hypothetical protein H721_02456 [Brucella ovis IntaBari-2006-46-332]|nr:hypothetical protein C010_02622 [Brucella ovis 80/125]ENR06712.1 hypothetical protein C961_02333 [Brucella ovis F8/05B]ENS93343.1 hypothetical protein B999_02598 [Brucella ovis 63/96]ENS97808.1 hypothetical protein C009_02471 [Brucella ovis 81/8]ENT76143.1 hypothetical protein H712_02601 [Brucella ovis IntaBari-2009-88-4]ENT78386.1 hypothetical protein H720_02392 [Brucella ovis IntaBari-2006-46-348]ENT81935.1 hypothetical protein H713_02604 [Brucella ovis IntaBari-2010-47-268]ENT86527.1 h